MIGFISNFLSSTLANLFSMLFSKKEVASDKSVGKQTGEKIASALNYGSIQQNTTNNYSSSSVDKSARKFDHWTNDEIKKSAQLLIVDDQDQTKTIKNLKKLGWQNTSQLREEDILNTDCSKYKEADLIFVDFSDIGPAKHGQGLSVLSSLMSNYGHKKYYILHTAHPQKITLQKLNESGLSIRIGTGWAQLTKGSPDYLLETTMFDGLRQIEK